MRLASASFLALVVVALPAAAQIERPRLGFVLDSGGALRPVMGQAASATLGDSVMENSVSFACSPKLCLIKTAAAVVAFNPDRPDGAQSVAAPPGPALIALEKSGAWIYFQASRQFARWHDGILDFMDFAPGGAMLSLRGTADGFDYAIVRRRVAWIEHFSQSDGSAAVIDWLGDSLGHASAAMLFDGGILSSTMDNVVLRRPNGQEITFPLAGSKKFYAAGEDYVEIVTPDGSWILRTDPGREQLSLLPGPAE